ncbi:MAG TPA: formylglycine-generating enzyme family protein [Gemmataceae bacterium]|jgi:formylglycine-generating enzyme required for sulfatase activity|nr:formylglycine-generating enzyme family protein [Gemmataceae bacterium]
MRSYFFGFIPGAALVLFASGLWSKDLPPNTLARKGQILTRFVDEFVHLTAGKGQYPADFQMGSDQSEHADERPAHKVTFNRAFAMAKYEVTQELYFVVAGNNPARWKGARNSVEMVNWHEARDFCAKATAELHKLKLIEQGAEIRLPSEAEWEYACRAGTATSYSFGDNLEDLGKYCWYKQNAPGNDPPVGKKLPNEWGLFDMHGYVWEWCADSGHEDYKNAPVDGNPWIAPDSKERMIRGGSYADAADAVRSSSRRAVAAEFRSDTVGFRCVLAKK